MRFLAAVPLLIMLVGVGLTSAGLLPAMFGWVLMALGALSGPAISLTIFLARVRKGQPHFRVFAIIAVLPLAVAVPSVIHDLSYPLINYLPVGSEEAARFYAECALETGVALVNCIPVFIASDPEFARRFKEKGLPIVGDDIKAQLGATITHRVLTDLFRKRGVKLERTYQLNTGGNTDFLNLEEDGEIWSADGRLLAQARQVGVVL